MRVGEKEKKGGKEDESPTMPLMLFNFYRVIRSWRKGRDFFARLEYKQDGIPSCRGCAHKKVVFYDHYYRKAKVASIDGRIPYTAQTDAYAKERCKLDIYVPKGKIAATVVWFHGGGLSGGNKNFPDGLKNSGLIVVAPNYRLSPKIPAHLAIDDAAEAVAWVFANIEKYGGSSDKIFVGGHSAGAYLSGMISFAPEYLAKHKIKNTNIKGCILLSGQATTHFRVRRDFGDTDSQWLPKIDKYSLLGNAHNKIPPCCLIVGDPALEFPERVEENILLASVLKKLNSSPQIRLYQLQGLDHSTVSTAIAPILKNFVRLF